MRLQSICRFVILCLLSLTFSHSQESPASQQGVVATFQSGEKVDVTVLPNFWFYSQAEKSPTPFLGPDPYEVEITGFVSVDLRGQYAFQADLNGKLVLEINGKPILEETSEGQSTEPSRPIRLNKGTNHFLARFTPPTNMDGWLRLNWIPKDSFPTPIPLSSITHLPTEPVQIGASLRHGRELLAEFRCVKCHVTDASGMAELAMDAPTFAGIGDRLNADWMAKWIENPARERPTARMPRLFHGATAKEDAAKTAAYLATLKRSRRERTPEPHTPEQISRGKHLFEALHCAACHLTPNGNEADSSRIELTHVGAKFKPGALERFLMNPQAHFAWNRMPNFKLKRDEAEAITSFLLEKSPKPDEEKPASPRFIAEGKALLESSGCLNCHSGPIRSKFTGPALADLKKTDLDAGCLAPHEINSKAPRFQFTETDRNDIIRFLKSDHKSLEREVPQEFAIRQTRLLNCSGCHGNHEGFPPLELLGGKLKPEWSEKFIAGEVDYKPRPWLEAKMPAFQSRARELAQGMAMIHGFAPHTELAPPVNEETAKIGQTLVSAAGGFSCVACHSVGETQATQVFESAGINLAFSGERLLKPFYHRWVLNPLAVDPTSKMPVYFDGEGRSPLTEVFEGDGHKQIDAMWEYIRLGSKMPPPPNP